MPLELDLVGQGAPRLEPTSDGNLLLERALPLRFEVLQRRRVRVGPGAKIQVSLGDGGEPVETLRFWRDVAVAGEAVTIQPDDVIDVLRRDPTFAELRPSESSVKFHDCRLGYYALPPREMQRTLVPVFALRGTASTPALPQYDFTRYVPAVPVPEKSRERRSYGLQAVAAF